MIKYMLLLLLSFPAYCEEVSITLMDDVLYKYGTPQKTLSFKLNQDTKINNFEYKAGSVLYGIISNVNEETQIVSFTLNINPFFKIKSLEGIKEIYGIKAQYIEPHNHYSIMKNKKLRLVIK